MTTEPFTLTNDGAPAYKKENPAIWCQPTRAALSRQAVHSILQQSIKTQYSLDDLVRLIGTSRKSIYCACKVLCMKGFAQRRDSVEVVINDEKSVNKRTIKVNGCDLMKAIKRGQW